MKVKHQTWSDVVKGLKKEDELERTNSDKTGNGSNTRFVEKFDSDESNHLKVKWMKGRRKRRQHHDIEGAKKGLTSRQANRKCRDA